MKESLSPKKENALLLIALSTAIILKEYENYRHPSVEHVIKLNNAYYALMEEFPELAT